MDYYEKRDFEKNFAAPYSSIVQYNFSHKNFSVENNYDVQNLEVNILFSITFL